MVTIEAACICFIIEEFHIFFNDIMQMRYCLQLSVHLKEVEAGFAMWIMKFCIATKLVIV